jgi:hypothetical protein
MRTPIPRYRCPLGRMQPESVDVEVVKQRGWREEHILVVSESDTRLDFIEREFIRRIGERLYGSGGRSRGTT